MKAFFIALLLLIGQCGPIAYAESFQGLHHDSPKPKLAAPLQWLAVPHASEFAASPALALPAAFVNAPESFAFQDATPHTYLPTGPTQNVWMRFTLAPTATVDTWYLRIPRVNPVQITLFTLDARGAWLGQSAGNLVAPAQWPLRTRVPTFEIKTSTTKAQAYFVRFENQSIMAERLQMLSSVEYITGAFGLGAMIGVLGGIFILLAALSVAAYGLARNTVFLWLAVFAALILFNQLVLLGFAGWQMWPDSQHLNRNMPWSTSFLALASGTWLMAKASYAQDTHPRLHQLLAVAATLSLVAAAGAAVAVDFMPRSVKNVWTGLVVVLVLGTTAWLTLRGNRSNGWLLLGLAPIALAALNRVVYNLGWLAHVEAAQIVGMFLSATGLLLLFLALVWRSRAQLLSGRRAQVFSDYDPETGLLLAEKAQTRLPRLLLRGSRLASGSGVMLLRWVDDAAYATLLSRGQRDQILQQIGKLMRGAARDIDSLIRHDENHFLILVEGPVSRDALADMASRIMAAALRGTDPGQAAGTSPAVNLHIALWHATMGNTSANNVMALLKRRLNTMEKATPRRVQFIDSTAGEPSGSSAAERKRRKRALLDKITQVEGDTSELGPLR